MAKKRIKNPIRRKKKSDYPGEMSFRKALGMNPVVMQVGGSPNNVAYDSPEYRKAYTEGKLVSRLNSDPEDFVRAGTLPAYNFDALQETGRDIKEVYPNFNSLTEEEKRYFRDTSPIGRSIRRKAEKGNKSFTDEVNEFATGMLYQTPMAALQIPQSALIEGVQALRGKDANWQSVYDPYKQRVPSDVWGFETTDDMSWYNPRVIGNFAMDMIADPTNLVGAGFLKSPIKAAIRTTLDPTGLFELTGKGFNQGKKFLVRNTPLRNAYKLNPNARTAFANLGETPHWLRGFQEEWNPTTPNQFQEMSDFLKKADDKYTELINLSRPYSKAESNLERYWIRYQDAIRKGDKKLQEQLIKKMDREIGVQNTPLNSYFNKLGSGSYGDVYSLNSNQALKKWHTPEQLPTNVDDIIEKHRQLPSDLQSRTIIPKKGAFSKADRVEIMPKVEGAKDMKPLNQATPAEMEQVLKEVDELNKSGIYVDISNPENILINPKTGKATYLDLNTSQNIISGKRYPKELEMLLTQREIPRQLPGSPNAGRGFKSEIDWGKWNPEIPNNKALMDEYLAIEQKAKADGTWMKNPDGSEFKGTPEQFVQQNSQNFKKAFPNVIRDEAGNVQKTYHGSQNTFDYFDPNIMMTGRTRGQGIYTSPFRERAASYATKGDKKVYEFYQNASNPQLKLEEFNKASDKRFQDFLKKHPKGSKDFDKKFYEFMNNEDKFFDKLTDEEYFKLQPGYDFYKAASDEYVVPFTNYPKSAVGNNGMFDMTNPNIYKSLVPIMGVGAAGTYGANQLMNQQQQMKKQIGGRIKLQRGSRPTMYVDPNDPEGMERYQAYTDSLNTHAYWLKNNYELGKKFYSMMPYAVSYHDRFASPSNPFSNTPLASSKQEVDNAAFDYLDEMSYVLNKAPLQSSRYAPYAKDLEYFGHFPMVMRNGKPQNATLLPRTVYSFPRPVQPVAIDKTKVKPAPIPTPASSFKSRMKPLPKDTTTATPDSTIVSNLYKQAVTAPDSSKVGQIKSAFKKTAPKPVMVETKQGIRYIVNEAGTEKMYTEKEYYDKYGVFPKDAIKKERGGSLTSPTSASFLNRDRMNRGVVEGPSVFEDVMAGLYGVGEGLLDAATMGATDGLTDMGFKALQGAAGTTGEAAQKQQGYAGVGNAVGAIGGAALGLASPEQAVGQSIKGAGKAVSGFSGSPEGDVIGQGIQQIPGMMNQFTDMKTFMASKGGRFRYQQGGQMLNQNLGLTEIGGPSHAEGGVTLPNNGQGPDVEVEGPETIYTPENYVMSEKIKASKTALKEAGISEKYAGKSYADISKAIKKQAGDKLRPNDKLTLNYVDSQMKRLIKAHDIDRQLEEQKNIVAATPEEQQAGYNMYPDANSIAFPGSGPTQVVPTNDNDPIMVTGADGSQQMLVDQPIQTQAPFVEEKLKYGGRIKKQLGGKYFNQGIKNALEMMPVDTSGLDSLAASLEEPQESNTTLKGPKDYKSPMGTYAAGAAGSMVGPLSNIAAAAFAPDPTYVAAPKFQKYDYTPVALQQASGNQALANTREGFRRSSPTQGSYLSNMAVASPSMAMNLGEALAKTRYGIDTSNIGIANQEAQLAAAQAEKNALLKDQSIANRWQLGLKGAEGIGKNVQSFSKDMGAKSMQDMLLNQMKTGDFSVIGYELVDGEIIPKLAPSGLATYDENIITLTTGEKAKYNPETGTYEIIE